MYSWAAKKLAERPLPRSARSQPSGNSRASDCTWLWLCSRTLRFTPAFRLCHQRRAAKWLNRATVKKDLHFSWNVLTAVTQTGVRGLWRYHGNHVDRLNRNLMWLLSVTPEKKKRWISQERRMSWAVYTCLLLLMDRNSQQTHLKSCVTVICYLFDDNYLCISLPFIRHSHLHAGHYSGDWPSW